MISRKCPQSVQDTLDRLASLLAARGLSVAARIEPALAAAKVGKDLRPTQLLIIGSPELGRSLMQSHPCIGLDLAIGAQGIIIEKTSALLDGLSAQATQS